MLVSMTMQLVQLQRLCSSQERVVSPAIVHTLQSLNNQTVRGPVPGTGDTAVTKQSPSVWESHSRGTECSCT